MGKEGLPGEVCVGKDGKTPIYDAVTGKAIHVPKPVYRPFIGAENKPGRIHLGLLRLSSRTRLYISVRLFGRWFRRSF